MRRVGYQSTIMIKLILYTQGPKGKKQNKTQGKDSFLRTQSFEIASERQINKTETKRMKTYDNKGNPIYGLLVSIKREPVWLFRCNKGTNHGRNN